MGSLSSVDPVTKLEVHELLSRYCWALDHNDSEEWGHLFTVDTRFVKPGTPPREGRQAVLSFPAEMHAKGGGNWRHHFTNVIVDRAENGRELKVRSLLTIRDCMDAAPVASADCIILVRRTDHWRIASFEAMSVCRAAERQVRNPDTEAHTALH
jgi:hypothetical protein